MKVFFVNYNHMIFRIQSYENKPGVYVIKRIRPEAAQCHVVKFMDNKFYCDCQGYKFRGICNHIHSLMEVIKNG